MRHAVLTLALGSFLFLMGCGPTESFHPLITPETALFEPSLEGDWTTEEDRIFGTMELTFSRADGSNPLSKDYSVKFGNGVDRVGFVGRLGRINEELYLDVSREVELNGDGSHLLKGVHVDPAFEQVLALGEGLLLVAQAETEVAEVKGTVCQLRLNVSPVHLFFKVKLIEKGLRLGYLKDNDLARKIKDKEVDIDCVLEPEFFLTATTNQLQQLMTQLENDPAAFNWAEFQRAETK